ncbi:hypothetical protein PE36_01367 [Moritella sp. PE36]|uniref:hypothetical protein n=1 Tax=Moritella sp. PE36 TaxID=58051 RepID=UPI0001568A85|nr:hypothetical protein [Moritella sp. PE36]EDM68588.1 hypothetical protein PE36_01367 [Moritella sp. PE36]
MSCITRSLLCLAIGSLLAGCGGGSDSDSNSSGGVATAMSGKVIDGYITGATVYLDLNFNNKRDENEPFTVTKGEGDFDLTIPAMYQKCSQYVPVVVDVPVGAVDSDSPNIPIDEAYSMVFPPSFSLNSDKDILNLTPLTTVVWSEVEKELSKSQSSGLSCESILADQQLRYDIGQKLTEQSKRVASHYNVTVDELYGDYVASDDVALHDFAKKLVPGLQKSYAETVELNEANPNADLAWVEYYLGAWDVTLEAYNQKWYRHQVILTANGSLNSETHLVSDDLQTKGALIAQGEMLTTVRYGVDITKRINLSRSTDNSKFKCYFDEILATQSSEVMNSIDVEVDNWDECSDKAIAGNVKQTLKTKDYQDNVLIRMSEYSYLLGNDSGFSDLIGVADTVKDEQIKERINAVRDVIVDTDFDSEANYSADNWSHTKYAIGNSQDKNARVETIRYNAKGAVGWQWQRVTYYENGKITNECGTSEANMLLEGC